MHCSHLILSLLSMRIAGYFRDFALPLLLPCLTADESVTTIVER